MADKSEVVLFRTEYKVNKELAQQCLKKVRESLENSKDPNAVLNINRNNPAPLGDAQEYYKTFYALTLPILNQLSFEISAIIKSWEINQGRK
jgi:hypothetical protein